MILVNGCSHTHGNINAIEGKYIDKTWGFQVGKHLNDDVTNIAKSGIGEEYILKSTIDWIIQHGNPDLVIILWPSTFRFEFPENYDNFYNNPFGLTKYKDGTLNQEIDYKALRSNEKEFVVSSNSKYIQFTTDFFSKRIDDRGGWTKAKLKSDPTSPFALFYSAFNSLNAGESSKNWFIEKKIFHMIALTSFLRSKNIKYYWADVGNVFQFNLFTYTDMEINKEHQFLPNTQIETFSAMNGYIPGFKKRTSNGAPYIDNHFELDWHEWFGKEFANFIITGKSIVVQKNIDKFYDEYLKAVDDPNRDPPEWFINKITKAFDYDAEFIYD